MKRIAALGIVAACALFVTRPALGADDCHVDLLVGGVFGQSQHIHSSGTPITDRFDVRGRGGGAAFGCAWFRNRWAAGVTGDFMRTNAEGHAQDIAPFNTGFTSYTEIDWIATLRGVVGYRTRAATLYLTGGGAAAPVKAKVCPTGTSSGSLCAAETRTLYGLVGGFGMDWQFARHWSLKGEVLFFGFEKRGFMNPPSGGFADRGGGLQTEIGLSRLGLAFHF
jgi:opacity protein-like surface antigen